MKSNYSDILSRIEEEPLWWDENGVPRFDLESLSFSKRHCVMLAVHLHRIPRLAVLVRRSERQTAVDILGATTISGRLSYLPFALNLITVRVLDLPEESSIMDVVDVSCNQQFHDLNLRLYSFGVSGRCTG